MKKIDDRRLYFYFSIITAVIGAVLALVFCYSACYVEPRIEKLLEDEGDINKNFKEAYIALKDPQVFARYENDDSGQDLIKHILEAFDKKIAEGKEFDSNDKIYLGILLERRKLGALLTRNTFIFFFIISILGWIFFFYEKFQLKKTAAN